MSVVLGTVSSVTNLAKYALLLCLAMAACGCGAGEREVCRAASRVLAVRVRDMGERQKVFRQEFRSLALGSKTGELVEKWPAPALSVFQLANRRGWTCEDLNQLALDDQIDALCDLGFKVAAMQHTSVSRKAAFLDVMDNIFQLHYSYSHKTALLTPQQRGALEALYARSSTNDAVWLSALSEVSSVPLRCPEKIRTALED